MKKYFLMFVISIFLSSCGKGDREKASFTITGKFHMDGTCDLTVNGVSTESSNYIRTPRRLDAVLFKEKLWFSDSCGSQNSRNFGSILIGSSIPDLSTTLYKAYNRVPGGGVNLVIDPSPKNLKFKIENIGLKEYSIEAYGGTLNVDHFNLHIQMQNIPFSLGSILSCIPSANIEVGELIYYSESNRERSDIEYTISAKAVLEPGSCF